MEAYLGELRISGSGESRRSKTRFFLLEPHRQGRVFWSYETQSFIIYYGRTSGQLRLSQIPMRFKGYKNHHQQVNGVVGYKGLGWQLANHRR